MRAVFADTYYFIALLDRRDKDHETARSYDKSLSRDTELVTTEMILVELLNTFSNYGPLLKSFAANFVTTLRGRPNTKIVPQTSKLFDDALSEYILSKDKRWGFTDCASYKTMKANGITEALTCDQHFVQTGFTALFR